MKLKVVLEKSDEGYTAYVPSLPGCISEGNTIDDAIENYLGLDKKTELRNASSKLASLL